MTEAPGTPINFEYYFISVPPPTVDPQPDFETGQSSQGPCGPPTMPEAPPQYGVTYPPFSHDPFMQPPYSASYYDPATFPPNYNLYPPFNRPAVWNEDTTPSMVWGLCTQMQRLGTYFSLAAYYGYEAQVRDGHIAPDVRHPTFYSFPRGGYGDQEGPSGFGGQGGEGDQGGDDDDDDVDDEEDRDGRDDYDARYGGSPKMVWGSMCTL